MRGGRTLRRRHGSTRGARPLVAGALLAVVLAAAPLPHDPPAVGQTTGKDDVDLTAAAGPGSTLVTAPGGGPVQLVGARPGGEIEVEGAPGGGQDAAEAFVEQHGAAFGEPAAARDLELVDAVPLGGGGDSFAFQQEHGGVPVLAGELRVQVDGSGQVISAAGELTRKGSVTNATVITANRAADAARRSVAVAEGVDPTELTSGTPDRWVYDPVLIGEPAGPNRVVWRVEVRSDGTLPVRKDVLVDAATGEVVLAIEALTEAKTRYVCDNTNVSGASYTCTSGYARTEGQGPSAVTEVNRAYDLSGGTYDFYLSRFGRDSINGAGLALRSTVRHCPVGESCPYANAFWDGSQMVYGDGYAGADDVVGHELTHGVTEYESNLVYMNQSGAINESMSDVFGELYDLTNGSGNDAANVRWDMGEDLPIGAIRDMADPGRFGDPDRMGSPNFYTGSGDGGGVHINSGVGNKAATLLVDGGTFNGRTITSIGITKTARIFYETNTTLLSSGSNYAALGAALPQACLNLVGVDGITAGDCDQVRSAVYATEMVVPPPPNDAFADAAQITTASGSLDATTVGATKQTGEPSHAAGNAGGASIWYRFTATTSGTGTIDTVGSSYDTMLAAYTGTAVGALTQRATNDDIATGNLQSRIQLTVTAGTTYWVAVDGYNGARGSVRLSWTLPGVSAGTGTITGTVTGPGSVSDVVVSVLGPPVGAPVRTGLTNGSGQYTITGVPVGTYAVGFVDRGGDHHFEIHDDAPSLPAATPVSVSAGATVTVDAALAGKAAPSGSASISGTVTGPGGAVPGAVVALLGPPEGAPVLVTVANASGAYTLGGIPAGTYALGFVDPTGAHRFELHQDAEDFVTLTPVTVAAASSQTINAQLTPA